MTNTFCDNDTYNKYNNDAYIKHQINDDNNKRTNYNTNDINASPNRNTITDETTLVMVMMTDAAANYDRNLYDNRLFWDALAPNVSVNPGHEWPCRGTRAPSRALNRNINSITRHSVKNLAALCQSAQQTRQYAVDAILRSDPTTMTMMITMMVMMETTSATMTTMRLMRNMETNLTQREQLKQNNDDKGDDNNGNYDRHGNDDGDNDDNDANDHI